MNNFWLRLWIWIKVAVLGLALIYVIAFVIYNQSKQTTFWIWPYQTIGTTTLALAFFAFIAGVIATLLVSTSIKTLRQLRAARERGQAQRIQNITETERMKASMLRGRAPGDSAGST